jgi:hypothetical protein
MTTASITHRPIPLTAAAALAVAALAVAGLTLGQHDRGTTSPAPAQTSQVAMPNPHAHYLRPVRSGVQFGMP